LNFSGCLVGRFTDSQVYWYIWALVH